MKAILFLSSLSLTLTLQTAQAPKTIARLIRASTSPSSTQRTKAQHKLIATLQTHDSLKPTSYDAIIGALDHDQAYPLLAHHKDTVTIALTALTTVPGFTTTLHNALSNLGTPSHAKMPFNHIKTAVGCIDRGEQIIALNAQKQLYDWSNMQTFHVITNKRWITCPASLCFSRTKEGKNAEKSLQQQLIAQQKIAHQHNRQYPSERVEFQVCAPSKIPKYWKTWFRQHHIMAGKI